jgi:hypothetical protein
LAAILKQSQLGIRQMAGYRQITGLACFTPAEAPFASKQLDNSV